MADSRLVFLETGAGEGGDRALREHAATSLETALGFVRRHGDGLSLARAHAILRAAPAQAVAEALAGAQSAEGAFPRLPPGSGEALGLAAAIGPAPLAGSVDGLAALADLRASSGPAVERAVALVARLQREDGSWGEGEGEADGGRADPAPASRLYATGRIGALLARTPYARPDCLSRAGDFLGRNWAPERVEGGQWDVLSGFAAFFSNLPHDLSDEGLQWCGRELERGFRTRRFEALPVLRVLLDCDAGGLPGFGVAPAELLTRLLDEQAGDGGFAELAADGPPLRVGATLDALLAVIGLCASL